MVGVGFSPSCRITSRCGACVLSYHKQMWRLCLVPFEGALCVQVFSSPSNISAWQYIPVDEVVIIDPATDAIALTSDLGPLFAKFSGLFTYDEEKSVMHWSFSGTANLWYLKSSGQCWRY